MLSERVTGQNLNENIAGGVTAAAVLITTLTFNLCSLDWVHCAPEKTAKPRVSLLFLTVTLNIDLSVLAIVNTDTQ